jgi:hypothetical protein
MDGDWIEIQLFMPSEEGEEVNIYLLHGVSEYNEEGKLACFF